MLFMFCNQVYKIMKNITKVTRLTLAFLALVVSSMMFFSSPVVAATSSLSNLNANNFEAEVQKSNIPVLVGFTAVWSAPSNQSQKYLEEIADANPNKIKVYVVDIDLHPDIAEKYGVKAIPTVIGYKNGSRSGQYIGPTTKDKYLSFVK